MKNDLASYQWKNRVLVLLADSADDADFKKEMEQIRAHRSEQDDRHLVILEETSAKGEWHEHFKVKSGFAAILIGKDGGEKWRRHHAFDLSEVFEKIDAMPMRQREMKEPETR